MQNRSSRATAVVAPVSFVLVFPGVSAIAADAAIDEIVVTATRTPEPVSHIGNSITVIDTPALVESQQTSIADLVATVPGVSFQRNGGIGELTSVFIRGANSDETVVQIDGVQLTDPWSTAGGVFFDNLLTAGAGRIEILRGAQSTLYGSQAMGGVINIISAEPSAPLAGALNVEGGTHGTGYGGGTIGGKDEALLWQLNGGWYGTSGFPVYDRVFGGKRNDAAQVGGTSARVRYDFSPQVQLDTRAWYTESRVDTDGYDTPTGAFGDDNEYSKKKQFIAYSGLSLTTADHSLTNRVSVQYTDSSQHEYDPGPRYAAAYYANGNLETFYGSGHVTREEYQGTWVFSPGWHAVFGAQHELSTISTDTPAFDYSPGSLSDSVTINSAYAQLQGEVASGLVLTAGERYDRHSKFGNHSTGQLAAAWSLGDATILRASFGQGFKAPSLYQLYAGNGVGNQVLLPETATSWDAGIEQHALADTLSVSATYFHRDSHDLIDFFNCPVFEGGSPQCVAAVFGGYYANIDEAKVHGVELQAQYRPDVALTLSANYTLTATDNLSPGSQGNLLPRRPRDMANMSVSYHWGSGLSATIAERYAGRSFDDLANQTALGGYVLTDLKLAWRMDERYEIYGRIDDATAKRYETAYYYGTPGRVVFAGLRAKF